MKYLFILLLGVSLLAGASPGVNLGVQGGFAFDSAHDPGALRYTPHSAWMAGLLVDLSLSHSVSLQPELLYVRRNASVTDGAEESRVYRDTVEIPALLKLKMGQGIRPYLFAGPALVFNVRHQVSSGGSIRRGTSIVNPDSFQLAAHAGAGLEVGAFFGNLRYSIGLTDFRNTAAVWQSRGIQALLGFRF